MPGTCAGLDPLVRRTVREVAVLAHAGIADGEVVEDQRAYRTTHGVIRYAHNFRSKMREGGAISTVMCRQVADSQAITENPDHPVDGGISHCPLLPRWVMA